MGEGSGASGPRFLQLRDGGLDTRLVEDINQRLDIFRKLLRILEDMPLTELPDRRRPREEIRHRVRVSVIEPGAISRKKCADDVLGIFDRGAHSASSSS